MDRIDRSEQKRAELSGSSDSQDLAADPDLADILNRFVFGEVYEQGHLTDRQRELFMLVVLATNQTLSQLRLHVGAAVHVGLSQVEGKEALYQCTPYIGFPKALDDLDQANIVCWKGTSTCRWIAKSVTYTIPIRPVAA
jgi:4-carboxymuconolactone decarboxylase